MSGKLSSLVFPCSVYRAGFGEIWAPKSLGDFMLLALLVADKWPLLGQA